MAKNPYNLSRRTYQSLGEISPHEAWADADRLAEALREITKSRAGDFDRGHSSTVAGIARAALAAHIKGKDKHG